MPLATYSPMRWEMRLAIPAHSVGHWVMHLANPPHLVSHLLTS